MKKPRNGIVVGGVDLFDAFGLVMTDDYTLGPPAPKTYYVDVPGGDGSIDDTEGVSGDVSYSNRSQSFKFLSCDGRDFERLKTDLSNFLNGREFDYELTMDPGYEYRGRFSVDEYYSRMHHGVLSVKVSAEPYKTRARVTTRFSSNGGFHATLECGRKRYVPTVECASECLVSVNGVERRFQPGSWEDPDLVLAQGENDVFACAVMPYGSGDVALSGLGSRTLADLGSARLADLMWEERPADDEAYAVYTYHEIKDL